MVSREEAERRITAAALGESVVGNPGSDLRRFKLFNGAFNPNGPISESEVLALEKFAANFRESSGKEIPIKPSSDFFIKPMFVPNSSVPLRINLESKEYGVVGVLHFNLGLPIMIRTIQGSGGGYAGGHLPVKIKGLPRIFYQKTKQHFYEVLIDHLISRVRVNYNPEPLPKNRAAAKPVSKKVLSFRPLLSFNPYIFNHMNSTTARGIISKYLGKGFRKNYVHGYRLIEGKANRTRAIMGKEELPIRDRLVLRRSAPK